jgi:predicted GNAT family N-acyltransferase
MDDFSERVNEQVSIYIGLKKSGKSFYICKYLRHVMKKKMYDNYVLVLPVYTHEQTGSYDFIDSKDKNIMIFEQYDDSIIESLIDFKTKNNKKKEKTTTCVIIDDASQNVYGQPMIHFISILRHTFSTLHILLHSAKKCLLPFMRANCDNIIIFRLSNAQLLLSIYEEWFSMLFPTFKDFKKAYLEHMSKSAYPAVLLYIRDQKIDYTLENWK